MLNIPDVALHLRRAHPRELNADRLDRHDGLSCRTSFLCATSQGCPRRAIVRRRRGWESAKSVIMVFLQGAPRHRYLGSQTRRPAYSRRVLNP